MRSRTDNALLLMICRNSRCLARTSWCCSCKKKRSLRPSLPRRRATVFTRWRRSAPPVTRMLTNSSPSGSGPGSGSASAFSSTTTYSASSSDSSGSGSSSAGPFGFACTTRGLPSLSNCWPGEVPTAAGPMAAACSSPTRSRAGELPQNCTKPMASVPSDAKSCGLFMLWSTEILAMAPRPGHGRRRADDPSPVPGPGPLPSNS
mmetsp:Transcript_58113/g.170587  ORF Transcript_58113/g.170587 Transcript_58113/m.170587 type:complete len:204 (-) Transcript_58113:7-618(-)